MFEPINSTREFPGKISSQETNFQEFHSNTCSSCFHFNISLTFHLAFQSWMSFMERNSSFFIPSPCHSLEHFLHSPSCLKAIKILQGKLFFNFSFPGFAALSPVCTQKFPSLSIWPSRLQHPSRSAILYVFIHNTCRSKDHFPDSSCGPKTIDILQG